jgi:hypothetical protein
MIKDLVDEEWRWQVLSSYMVRSCIDSHKKRTLDTDAEDSHKEKKTLIVQRKIINGDVLLATKISLILID